MKQSEDYQFAKNIVVTQLLNTFLHLLEFFMILKQGVKKLNFKINVLNVIINLLMNALWNVGLL